MPGSFGEPSYHYREVSTTMRVATDLGRAGSPHGTAVTAGSQTRGRGRLQRSWHSAPGQGLYLSLVLRPTCGPDDVPVLALVAGLAVKDALQRTAGVQCDLRWPNDVLIRERKCCGILAELVSDPGDGPFVVLGIGINLNHADFPPELADTATSLRIETGREWTRDSILHPVLECAESCYDLFAARGPEPILEAFQRESSYVQGRRVVIEGLPPDVPGPTRGVTAGLSPAGQLLLREEDGRVRPVLAGSVRPDRGTM